MFHGIIAVLKVMARLALDALHPARLRMNGVMAANIRNGKKIIIANEWLQKGVKLLTK